VVEAAKVVVVLIFSKIEIAGAIVSLCGVPLLQSSKGNVSREDFERQIRNRSAGRKEARSFRVSVANSLKPLPTLTAN
jgi:hypothetical protein